MKIPDLVSEDNSQSNGRFAGALQIGRRTFQNFLSTATDLPSDGRKGADWYSDTSLAKFSEYVGVLRELEQVAGISESPHTAVIGVEAK